MIVYPYKKGSKSAKDLANALGCKRMKVKGSSQSSTDTSTIINWGSGRLLNRYPQLSGRRILNHPEAVAECANKLKFYNKYYQLCTWFTTSYEEARAYMQLNNCVILARDTVTGSGGNGITVCNDLVSLEENRDAVVFTEYQPKDGEYRVHFFKREVELNHTEIEILMVKKVRREGGNTLIRNHSNGYVFVENFKGDFSGVIDKCMEFINRTELDFGAIDVIKRNSDGAVYLLEVNTAPGLTGRTLEWYKNNIRRVA